MRLLCLVFIWAVSWPAVKIGVTTTPPLWYGFLRYLIAALCLFGVAIVRRETLIPPRADWPLVCVVGLFQLAAFSALTGIALTALPPGRASVLAYSTPLWVVPLAAWRLGEPISTKKILGVVIGMLGALIIAAPTMSLPNRGLMHAYGLLAGAAFAWAIAIVFVRSHRFQVSALALAPWQMSLAAAVLLPLALLFEHAPERLAIRSVLSLAYVGPVATAFAYWSVVEAGRRFSATTVSMALLAVPAAGILISATFLGERIDAPLLLGALSIGAGILMTATRSLEESSIEFAARK